MAGVTATPVELNDANIFYNGFTDVTGLRSFDRTVGNISWLKLELDKFVPDLPEGVHAIPRFAESSTNLHEKQMVALLMVMGRRLDTINQNIVQDDTNLCGYLKSIDAKLARMLDQLDLAREDNRLAFAEQQKGEQTIAKAMEKLQLAVVNSTSPDR